MMSGSEVWLTIIGLTAVTVVTRNTFLVLGHRVTLPERVQHALRFAPAGPLVPRTVPEGGLQSGALGVGLGNPKLVASVVAVATLLLTRRAVAAIGLGMLGFTLVRLL